MDSTISILVVDDEPDLLDNISLALEAEDYQVFTANNGSEALEILAAQPVNLILADIAMPDMNGYQLYQQVRQNSAWVLIPFIFLTARTMDSDIRYGKELGVDDYLTKPIRTKEAKNWALTITSPNPFAPRICWPPSGVNCTAPNNCWSRELCPPLCRQQSRQQLPVARCASTQSNIGFG